MTALVFKCKDCGTIMVVDLKDAWCLKSCTKCESTNIINLDDEWETTEILEEKE